MSVPVYNYSIELIDDIPLYYSDFDDLIPLYPYNCKYFNGGDSLPAGRYSIIYKTGAIKYYFDPDDSWKVNCEPTQTDPENEFVEKDIIDPLDKYNTILGYEYNDVTKDEVGFVVCFTPDKTALPTAVGKRLCTGNNTAGFALARDAIADSLGATVRSFSHAGGPIAIYFHACVPGSSSSSASSPSGYEAIKPSAPYGQPQFILVRHDAILNADDYGIQDPGDYQCGDDAPVYHKRTFYTHFKRPGTNTVLNSFTLDIVINAVNSGSLRAFYNGSDVTGGWQAIGVGTTTITTITIPIYSGSLTLTDELLEIQVKKVNDYDILDWTVNVNCPACPVPTDPIIIGYSPNPPTDNKETVSWNTVTDTKDIGIIDNYDIFYKYTTEPFYSSDPNVTIYTDKSGTPATYSVDIFLDPGHTYNWKIVANSSCGSSPGAVGDDIEIPSYNLRDVYIRPKALPNFTINKQVKLIWGEDSDTVKSFLIYRGHAFYEFGVSTFDWEPFCIWEKKIGNSSFEMILDISKNSDTGVGNHIISYSPSGGGDPIPDVSVFTHPTLGFDNNIIHRLNTGITYINITNSVEHTRSAEDPPSSTRSHHELWYRIECLSDTILKGDLRYILVGDSSTTINGVACISSKTQFLKNQQVGHGIGFNPPAGGTRELVPELEELWLNNQAYTVGAYIGSGTDPSRTAVDLAGLRYNREVCGWVAFRGGNSVGRYNLVTGELRQLWTDTFHGPIGNKPRGITVNPVTGFAYCCGGPGPADPTTIPQTQRMCILNYKDSHISGGFNGRLNYTVGGGGTIISASINNSGSNYPSGNYTITIFGGIGGILNYTIGVGGTITATSVNTPGTGYTPGLHNVYISGIEIYNKNGICVYSPNIFPVSSTINILDDLGVAFYENYGCTQDRGNRVWFVENYFKISGVDKGSDKYGTGGGTCARLNPAPNYYTGTWDAKSIWSYGICTDFFGDIWSSGGMANNGYIMRIPISRVHPHSGYSSLISYSLGASYFVGGITADIPTENGKHFNIWTTAWRNKAIFITGMTHTETPSVNIATIYKQEILYLSSISVLSIFKNGVHGAAFTSENDIVAVGLDNPFVFKIYQKSPGDFWISTVNSGGDFRYNDKRVETDFITTSGTRYRTVPLGSKKEDDWDGTTYHPMWHECYDAYDTNSSYDVSQLDRYKAWKALCALTGPDIPGTILTELYPTRPDMSLPLKFSYKRTPHYNPSTNNFPVGELVEGPPRSNVPYGGSPGVANYWKGQLINGVRCSVFTTTCVTSLGNSYKVAVFTFGHPGWISYIYSDFIGGVGTFAAGNYPITNTEKQYLPLISKVQ
jgi:hypothetical protein